jgi:hypothetical protein
MILNCCCCNLNPQESSSFDWVTTLLAVIALIVSIYLIYLSKKVEIKTNKFNKLCLEPLEKYFDVLSDLILINKDNAISLYLNDITSINSDINVFLTKVKTIYPDLNIDFLQDTSIVFTDKAYENGLQNLQMYTIFGDFLEARMIILDTVYNHSIEKEIRIFKF